MPTVSAFKFLVFLVASLSLCLWGCGGGGGGGNSSQSPSSRSPTIGNTTFDGVEDSTLTGRIALSDPQGGALSVHVSTQPQSGTLTGPDNTGAFTYMPRADFYGADTFTMSVTNAQALTASASIVLNIAAVNDAPTAMDDSVMVAPAVPTTIAVLGNDKDIEGQALHPEIIEQSPDGSAEVQSDGTIKFTPSLGFLGNTQLQYRAVDVEGGASEPVTATINVRPVKSVAYISAASEYRQVVLQSPSSTRYLSDICGFGCEIGDLLVSANGNTALWLVSAQGAPNNAAYHYIDLTDVAATDKILHTYQLYTGVKLSPTGTHALVPEMINGAGGQQSVSVHLTALWKDESRPIHSTPETEQVSAYEFSPNGDFVAYRTNTPSFPQNDVKYWRADTGSAAPSILLAHSLSVTADVEPMKLTPDGSRLIFSGSGIAGVRTPALLSTQSDGSTNAQIMEPSNYSFLSIPNFEISATSRYAAFLCRSWYFPPGVVIPPPSFVVDLQTGSYTQIRGASNTDRVTPPVFNRGGTKVAVGVSSATETAIYEASVDNPAVLTRVSAVHESRVNIGNLRYAANDRIVYTADVRQADVYEIFVAKDGQEQRLNADLGTSVSLSLNNVGFVLSRDGTTVAYGQSEVSGVQPHLFLIDVTTPGSPLEVGEGAFVNPFSDPTYVLVD